VTTEAPIETAPRRAPEPSPAPVPHPWWRRAIEGAVAGVAATAAMTGVRMAADRAGIQSRRPAHSEVVRRLRAITGRKPWGHEAEMTATITHYAIGAAAGAAYAVVAPRRARPVGGVAYSLTIWLVSYFGVLPWLRLMPRPERDDTGRQVVLAVDHVVYGLVLDGTLAALERR
jgi:Family of unknown function (DUF6789)